MAQECKQMNHERLDKSVEADNTGYDPVNLSNLPTSRRCYGSLERREIPRSFIDRFHSKYKRIEGDNCWLWRGGKTPKGYGQFSLGRFVDRRQHVEYAHRIAYVLTKGNIPEGMVVRHTCDVPACCNPDHLVLGTQADNVNDAAQKGHYNVPHNTPQRKLTDAQVEEIRTSPEKGIRLAERFGVSKTLISLIRSGKRGQHAAPRRKVAA